MPRQFQRQQAHDESASALHSIGSRVHRVQRWRMDGCFSLKNGVNRRQDSQSSERRNDQPADHRAAQRRRLRSALAEPDRHRQHAEDHRGRGHQDRAQPAGSAFLRRLQIAPPLMPRPFGERDQQNRVRHRDSNRHDRAHERLHVQRRPRDQQHQQHSAQHRGNRQHDRQRQPHRLEIRRQQKKDHQDRQQQTSPQPGKRLFQRRNLAAHLHADTLRRVARRRQSLIQLPRRFAQRHAMDIRRQADHVLPVDSARSDRASCPISAWRCQSAAFRFGPRCITGTSPTSSTLCMRFCGNCT